MVKFEWVELTGERSLCMNNIDCVTEEIID